MKNSPPFRLLRSLAVTGALALGVTQVSAGTINANVVIDLNTALSGGAWVGYGHALTNSVQVSSGDTVIINIDFLGSQTLTWSGNGTLDPWLMLGNWPGPYNGSQSGWFNWADTSVNFVNLTQGTQIADGSVANGSDGSIHLGPTFAINGGGITRTFSGVEVSFLATWDDGDPYREYGTIGYQGYGGIFQGQSSIGQGQAVPDNGSVIAMLCLSFLGLVSLRRRR